MSLRIHHRPHRPRSASHVRGVAAAGEVVTEKETSDALKKALKGKQTLRERIRSMRAAMVQERKTRERERKREKATTKTIVELQSCIFNVENRARLAASLRDKAESPANLVKEGENVTSPYANDWSNDVINKLRELYSEPRWSLVTDDNGDNLLLVLLTKYKDDRFRDSLMGDNGIIYSYHSIEWYLPSLKVKVVLDE